MHIHAFCVRCYNLYNSCKEEFNAGSVFFFKVVFIKTMSVHGHPFFFSFLSLQYRYDHVEVNVNIHGDNILKCCSSEGSSVGQHLP